MTSRLSKLNSSSTERTTQLTANDYRMFAEFHISKQLLAEARVSRVDDATARAQGFAFNGDLSGLVFPYRDATGREFNARLRRDYPDIDESGKPQNKYISKPKPHRRGLFVLPGDLSRLGESDEIILVESEKAALACTEAARRAGRHYKFVATGGCQGWRDRDSEFGVLADLRLLGGRKVGIFFDSNVATNPTVQFAELKLAEYLMNINARVSCYRIPQLAGVNGPDDFLSKKKYLDLWRLLDAPVEPWLDLVGESWEKYSQATLPDFLIKDFLTEQGATFVGGPSGHGKTFLLLSMVQSLLTGSKLFGHFDVIHKASRVIYLTPEIGLGAFRLRAQKFGLDPFIEQQRLLVRTYSAYPMIKLTDPALLLSSRGADIFLDTAVRFVQGDENSSGDNARGLADAIFRLLSSGARSVIAAAHSSKGFAKDTSMDLDNAIRGSGDIGAMLSAAWGIKILDRDKTLVYVQNIKPRDFSPPPPFQIQGRPHIDHGKGFQIAVPPGQCLSLMECMKQHGNKTGRPQSLEKQARTALVLECVRTGKKEDEIIALLKAQNLQIPKLTTLRKEISIARNAKY